MYTTTSKIGQFLFSMWVWKSNLPIVIHEILNEKNFACVISLYNEEIWNYMATRITWELNGSNNVLCAIGLDKWSEKRNCISN